MGSLKLFIKSNKNEGLVISPSELISLYLTGIPLCYPNGGGDISSETIKHMILTAQKEMENFLSLKINKQIVWESKDFLRESFFRWGYIKSTFPIMEPLALKGHINEVKQVDYPREWLSIKRGTDTTKFRNLYLIPNTAGGAAMSNTQFVFSGITPHMGFFGTDFIPNYWRFKYCTGWDVCPIEIVDAIAMYVAIQILAIAGDLIYGAGIGNQTISLDGISQTYSTTKGGSGGAFGGRIKQYLDDLNRKLLALKAEYCGIRFSIM